MTYYFTLFTFTLQGGHLTFMCYSYHIITQLYDYDLYLVFCWTETECDKCYTRHVSSDKLDTCLVYHAQSTSSRKKPCTHIQAYSN